MMLSRLGQIAPTVKLLGTKPGLHGRKQTFQGHEKKTLQY